MDMPERGKSPVNLMEERILMKSHLTLHKYALSGVLTALLLGALTSQAQAVANSVIYTTNATWTNNSQGVDIDPANAGNANGDGSLDDTAIGYSAGWSVTGTANTVIGVSGGRTITGNENVGLGDYASWGITGTGNTGAGANSSQGVSGNYNSGVGYESSGGIPGPATNIVGNDNFGGGSWSSQYVTGSFNSGLGDYSSTSRLLKNDRIVTPF
jgi:hypothetical protein